MNSVHIFALVTGLTLFVGMLELLRRRQLREKYTVLWLLVGIAIAILAIAPGIVNVVGDLLHVADPPQPPALCRLRCPLVVHRSTQLGDQQTGSQDAHAG